MVTFEGNTKGWGRPKLTLEMVVLKDLSFLNFMERDALNRF